MIVYLLFSVLKSVYPMSKPGWRLTSFKLQKFYFLLLNELLTCSIFQNSWIIMALVLNSALQLATRALFSTSLFRCISMSWMSIGLHTLNYGYQLHPKSSVCWCCQNSSLLHLCCLVLTIATPYLLVFLSILVKGFKESKMRQPDQYLEHPDLSTSLHSSRIFTGCLSIGESYTRSLHYVILHYLALALNICLTLLMFTPLPDPCALPQIPVSWALPM